MSDGLRIFEIDVGDWIMNPVRMREPCMADYLAVEDAPSDMLRTLTMLGMLVLNGDGESIGKDVMLRAPPRVFRKLAAKIEELIGEGKEGEDAAAGAPVPLAMANGSGTASPSH